MKRVLLLAWILGIAGSLYISSKKSFKNEREHYSILSTPPFSEMDSHLVNILTLGHRGLYDDFLNIWILQILADKTITDLDLDKLAAAIRNITKLHPKIESLYMVSCFTLALDLKHPEYCENIMMDGLNAFPQSWRLPMTQGFIFSNLLNMPAKASGFYQLAASRSDSPEYVGSLAKKLVNEEEVTPQEIKNAIDMMMQLPGGSRVAEFLNGNIKRHHDIDTPQGK